MRQVGRHHCRAWRRSWRRHEAQQVSHELTRVLRSAYREFATVVDNLEKLLIGVAAVERLGQEDLQLFFLSCVEFAKGVLQEHVKRGPGFVRFVRKREA